MVEDFERCYRGVHSKDGRFDGVFVTAVTSTGIYCRPSCPATTPKRENVRFLRSAAAAQSAGFRACKRCRPDASPGSPEWNVRADVVGRAMRLIADGSVDREGVAGLAARLGFSERHLHRQLVAELGAGPLALARAQRAQTARLLIETSDLPFTDIAFAAGFPSIRQFNETVREVFATTPTELRRAAAVREAASGRRGAAHGAGGPADAAGAGIPASGAAGGAAGAGDARGTSGDPARGASAGGATRVADGAGDHGVAGPPPVLTLRLRHRPPLHGAGLLAWLGDRAVPGVEALDGRGAGATYRRVLVLPHGPGVVALTPRRAHVDCTLRLSDMRDLSAAVQRCRRLLDLDADPLAIAEALGDDPIVGPLVRRVPGRRVPGAVDGAELAVRAVLGQQVSVGGARTLAARLVAEYGEPLPAGLVESCPAAAPSGRAGQPAADAERSGRATLEAAPSAAPSGRAAREAALSTGPSGRAARVDQPAPGGLTHAFPTAAALAAADPDRLPMPRARGRALVTLCAALAAGDVELDPGADRARTREQLLALPGIGPWTAEYVAMRALGDPDAFPATDLGLRHALARLDQPHDPRAGDRRRPISQRNRVSDTAVAALSERWRPWRAYAALHLWATLTEEDQR